MYKRQLKDDDGDQSHLVKLSIPRASVAQMRNELNYLGINKLTVFPQLEHVAERVQEVLR